jgi:hypothetical protein
MADFNGFDAQAYQTAVPRNKLFKLNHFITKGAAGNRDEALNANSYGSIMGSVQKCVQVNGVYPNWIHLDFVEQNMSDSVRAVNDINNLLASAA